MSLDKILSFDVNRVLLFDLDSVLFWHIPPTLLLALAAWFIASFLFS